MIGIDWVYEFTLIQWLVLAMMIGYVVAWIGGVDGFKDVDKRFLRIESYDDFYVGTLGEVLMIVRNLAGFGILFITFLIVT